MLTIVIANITPAEAAAHFQGAGLSGTAVASIGFGSWGIEPGARLEFGDESEHYAAERATAALLTARGESAAFAYQAAGPKVYGRGPLEARAWLITAGGSRAALGNEVGPAAHS